MTVTIQAAGSLRTYLPSSATLNDVHTVGEAIERLSLPPSDGLAILVNGRLAHWHMTLNDGDTIQLVPQLAGG